MTQSKTLAAKSMALTCKLQGLEQVVGSDGKITFRVAVYPPWGDGYSKYPVNMFLTGPDTDKTADALKGVVSGTVVSLAIYPSKVKQGKEDSGEFGNYFWNVSGMAGTATADDGILYEEEGEEPDAQARRSPSNGHADPTRRSIERQTALKAAVEISIARIAARPLEAITIRELMQMANEFFVWLQEGLGAQQENTTSPAPEAPQTASSAPTEPVYGKARLTRAQLMTASPKVTSELLLLQKAKEYFGMELEAIETELGDLAAVKDWPAVWQQLVELKT